jgi:hypothetical protein
LNVIKNELIQFKNLNLFCSFEKGLNCTMEETIDIANFQNISNLTSPYEASLMVQSEKAEEFHNEFYDSSDVILRKNYKTKIPENRLSETLPEEDSISIDDDVEEYLRSSGIDHKFEVLSPNRNDENTEDVNVTLRKTNLKALSPVRKVETKEVEIPVLESIDSVDYRNFLHREIGEPREMFSMRESIAHMLAKANIPRGSRFVAMDTATIMLLSRMMTNKLWFGMTYNKDQETLIKAVAEYIPGLPF